MDQKQRAGEKALDYIEDGMTIGLGTGSTLYWTLMKLGERVRQGLKVRGIPTSVKTEKLARGAGIPLTSFNEVKQLDLTVDGADEVDPELRLIKGGGGALLREKLIARASRQLIIVADESKKVSRLGAFPLPVEIVPFAWQTTMYRLEQAGCRPELRMREGKPFVTDNGNYLLDCLLGGIERPEELHTELKGLTGVVETGLFLSMADRVIIGTDTGVEVLDRTGV